MLSFLLMVILFSPNSESLNSCFPSLRTKYVCESSDGYLQCENSTVIEIVDGIFGRISRTICNPHKDYPESKYYNANGCATSISEMLEKECNGRNSCFINSTAPYELGDPCEDIVKYLEIHYLCYTLTTGIVIDKTCTTTTSTGTINKIICQDNKEKISCSDGKIIIVEGFYGRKNRNICNRYTGYESDINCYKNVLGSLSELCNGNSTCTVQANSNTFGDPCYRTSKYLSFNYMCY